MGKKKKNEGGEAAEAPQVLQLGGVKFRPRNLEK